MSVTLTVFLSEYFPDLVALTRTYLVVIMINKDLKLKSIQLHHPCRNTNAKVCHLPPHPRSLSHLPEHGDMNYQLGPGPWGVIDDPLFKDYLSVVYHPSLHLELKLPDQCFAKSINSDS